MAEKEPSPLQPAVWEAETSGHPGNGLAQSGQYFSNKHRNPPSTVCWALPAGHAEGEYPGTVKAIMSFLHSVFTIFNPFVGLILPECVSSNGLQSVTQCGVY